MRIAHHAELHELGDRCRSGVESSVHRLGCLECGARCCPASAITKVEKPGPFEVL